MAMTVHLSPRLAAVAELVPAGSRVIDVGTDHALVPVWLAQSRRVSYALGIDIRKGPLMGAAALVERTETGHRVSLKQTDGLLGLGPADGDAVIITGMGGETISAILSAAPWTKTDTLLILSPQSKKAHLRRFLKEKGYRIEAERLVEDAGRIYPILCVRGGAAPDYTEAEFHLGLLSQAGREPLFPKYLAYMRAQAAKAAPYDGEMAALVREYDEIKERYAL